MQKFNYTPSNPFSGSVSSLAIGAGMVVVPLVYPFGIRIGRMRILGPTAVTIIFVIGGLALLAFTVREIMQARKLIAQGGEITVEGGKVTIPVVRKKEVVNESFLLSEVEYTKFDEEENEFKISLPADHGVRKLPDVTDRLDSEQQDHGEQRADSQGEPSLYFHGLRHNVKIDVHARQPADQAAQRDDAFQQRK